MLLAACNKAEETNRYDEEFMDQATESAANRAFLDEEFDSNPNKSDFENNEISNKLDDTETSSGSSNKRRQGGTRSCTCSAKYEENLWIDDYTTKNAKLKLI